MKILTAFTCLLLTLSIIVAASLTIAAKISNIGGPLDDLSMFGYQPKASPAQVVTAGSTARFTILTPHVIRMEYSASGSFEDRATLAVVNRVATPVPYFTQSTSGNTLTIQTEKLTLTYQIGQSFTGSSLQVKSNENIFNQYAFGDKDTGNLLGTIRSLDDHCTINLDCDQNQDVQTNGENLHCAWAVFSRNGWTTVNDTKNFIMGQGGSPNDSWFSNKASMRSSSDVDMYFFGHGQNYKQALADFTQIGGKVPIPSRPLLGSWFTRWFDYDATYLKNTLLPIFVKNGIPLDVLILDMNWHQKNEWTGFTWDGQLYPFPNATLGNIRKSGLLTGANIHDAQGVNPFEAKYAEFAELMGYPPNANTPIMFSPLNATYMRGVEDILLGPSGANFDFYWTDWQQGGTNGGCNGNQLNPTMITDHVRWSDNMRRGINKRSNNFARFGGLGAHRYPVGFTGDVSALSWECFSYQPYFSVSASNVAYGYPSHDLVGSYNDHELHVRWMQFGAFSGVMRIHDRGMSSGLCWDADLCAIVDIWTLPYEYFDAIRDAMVSRVRLLPYIYREARRAYDTGLNFVHGLFVEWPTHNSAYALGPAPGDHAPYMFGSDIMVAIITQAADQNTNLVTLTNVWIPPGTWYDNVFGTLITGPQTIASRTYALADIPMFIKAGAAIPRIPAALASKMGQASQAFSSVDWYIYPGLTNGAGTMYEDDGDTWDYITSGAFAFTNCTYTRPSPASFTATLSTPYGGVPSAYANVVPKTRNVRFFLVSMSPISSGKCNGNPLVYNEDGGANTWYFDGLNAELVVDCGAVPTNVPVTVTVNFIVASVDGKSLHGAKGYGTRTLLAKHILDNRQLTPGSHNPTVGYTKQAGAHAGLLAGLAPTADANSWAAATGSNYQTLLQNAINELQGSSAPLPPQPNMTALVQLYDIQRNDMALCASLSCLSTNSYYRAMWIEGYQPAPNTAGSVALYDYFSYATNDNWATTDSNSPADGYSAAIFSDGLVLNSATAGTSPICLQVWQQNNQDHMTIASQQGLQYAQANGYQQVGGCIGYALAQPVGSNGKMMLSKESELITSAFASLQRERGGEKAVITAKDILDRINNMNKNKNKKITSTSSKRHEKQQRLHSAKNRKQLAEQKLKEDSSKQRAIDLIGSSFV